MFDWRCEGGLRSAWVDVLDLWLPVAALFRNGAGSNVRSRYKNAGFFLFSSFRWFIMHRGG
jgi:hypothetical protein